MSLLLFLLKVVGVSLPAVLWPGPITAAAVAMGHRRRYAGAFIGLGHAIIELPLMILIMLGMDKLLKSTRTQMVIGLAGGAVLLVMAIRMLTNLKTADDPKAEHAKAKPVLTGLILSVSNPYFLLWWATVGLTLATGARQLGIWAFGLFAVVHWLCDCVWLQTLSWASFKGTRVLGPHSQRIVLLICALTLLAFGAYFIYSALSEFSRLF